MANVTKVTPQKKGKFLAELRRTGNATFASRTTGISRREWYRVRLEEADFAEEWDHARAAYAEEVLEPEADRRAVEGVTHQLYFDKDGNPVGEVRRYSDTLLIFRLKALKAEEYKDAVSSVVHKHEHGGTIQHQHQIDARLAQAYADLEERRNGHSAPVETD